MVRRENQCSAVRINPLNFLLKERAAFEPVAWGSSIQTRGRWRWGRGTFICWQLQAGFEEQIWQRPEWRKEPSLERSDVADGWAFARWRWKHCSMLCCALCLCKSEKLFLWGCTRKKSCIFIYRWSKFRGRLLTPFLLHDHSQSLINRGKIFVRMEERTWWKSAAYKKKAISARTTAVSP